MPLGNKIRSHFYFYLYTFMHFLLLYNEDGMILYSGEEGDILILAPHPRQEEEAWVRRGDRNMIKEPALSSSSAIFPLPLFSAFLGRSHEFFWGMGWLPPPALTSVPLILTKPWFSLLQNEDNNSTYLLRSPGKKMQVQFLAQGLAQREDSTMLNAHFFTSLAGSGKS